MLLYIVLFLSTCSLIKAKKNGVTEEIGFLLPGNIIPSHYNLRWFLIDDCSYRDEFTFHARFTGIAHIILEAVKPGVKVIQMNALNLTIFGASLHFGNESSASMLQYTYRTREQKVLFHVPFELPVSEPMHLNIFFKGSLQKFKGMYMATELISDGISQKLVKRKIIGTLLEPSYARWVYPCFDEPAYKARFTVTIETSECLLEKGYVVYSNTPVKRIERRKGRAIIHFEKTNVAMSTYLMTIGFAPYASTETQKFNSSYPDASKTEWKAMRTWGTKDFVHSETGLAVQRAGLRLMEIFTNDFRIGYPLKKLDQLNIAMNSVILGMENWGAVFYRFFGSPLSNVLLIAHELAHQWFGNLVTCHWWSDTWLNEGFATYFSSYGAHKFALENPAEGWRPLLNNIYSLLNALQYDVLQKRPLTQHVEDPKHYGYMFDRISYLKGGSIIRMWNHILGERAFLSAIQKYLDERKEGVAAPKHLFQAFDSVVKGSLSNFGEDQPSKYFQKWTTQSGYPLVTVTQSETNASEYILTQRIFKAGDDQTMTKWTIPISYSTNANMDFDKTHAMVWFREDDETAMIRLTSHVNWIIVNNKFTGYYRVDYDIFNWNALSHILANSETYESIPIENRIQILSDLGALAKEGSSSVGYDFVMNLTLYLKHEMDYYPWKAALDDMLSFLDIMLSKSEAFYGIFREYVKDLLQDNYSRLSYNRRVVDSVSDRELRPEIVNWACRMNHSGCITDSRNFLYSYSPRGNIYDEPYEERSLYETAYCTNITHSDNDWNLLWDKYLTAGNMYDKKTILRGIACSDDKEFIRRLLMKSVDYEENLSNYERRSVLETVINTDPRLIGMAFDFFMSHYEIIKELYAGSNPVVELLEQFSRLLGTDEELDKMKGFLAVLESDDVIGLTSNDMKRILAETKSNNVWIKEKSDQVIFWLLRHYGKPSFRK